ncbi:hypothetical protein MHU86_20547 [Fragilaria crotonensis]|nr:hypothetical protein MHU86_20547 [Fragilaria crotonensis]
MKNLIGSAKYGYLDKVPNLLRRGANVNAKDDDGNTALHYAAMSHDVRLQDLEEVVRALLNHNGVDVNIKNDRGNTALDVAFYCENFEVAGLLKEHTDREKHSKENEQNPHKRPEVEAHASEEKRPSSTDEAFGKGPNAACSRDEYNLR